MRRAAILTAALLVAGCATAPVTLPVEVTRYRVDEVGRGPIAIVAKDGDPQSVEFKAYAAAVADALTKQGYNVLPEGQRGIYVAQISVTSDRRFERTRSPVSVGLGGGTWSGGGVGLGGGISFPIGRGKTREDVATKLMVSIVTREGEGVWEGQALGRDIRTAGTTDLSATATRMANALFTGFPGESGRTIEVK